MKGTRWMLFAALAASVALSAAAVQAERKVGDGSGVWVRVGPPDLGAPDGAERMGSGRLHDPQVEPGRYLVEVQVVSAGYARLGCMSSGLEPGVSIQSVGGGVTLRTEPIVVPAPLYPVGPYGGLRDGRGGGYGGGGYGGGPATDPGDGMANGAVYHMTPHDDLGLGQLLGDGGGSGIRGGGLGGGPLDGFVWSMVAAYAVGHPCEARPGYGVALGQALTPGEEFANTIGWPDDEPRYCLEREENDTFRRARIEESEGYDVTVSVRPNVRLQETDASAIVEVNIARRAFLDAKYDAAIGAYLTPPTVVSAQCATSLAISDDKRTVLVWQQSHSEPRRPALLDRSDLSDFSPESVDDTALIISITPGGHPVATAPGPLVDGARGSLVGARTPTGRAIRVEMLLFEAEVGTDGWRSIAESGDAFTGLANAFAHEYAVTPVAAPVLLCREGEEASLSIGDDAPGGVDAVGLGDRIRVTPEDAGDGRIVLALTWEFHGPCLADPAGEQAAFQVMASQQVRAHFTCEPGGQHILRGVFRLPMRSGPDDTEGVGVGGPIERFLRVIPTLTEGEAIEDAWIGVVPPSASGPIHLDVGRDDGQPRTHFGRYQEF